MSEFTAIERAALRQAQSDGWLTLTAEMRDCPFYSLAAAMRQRRATIHGTLDAPRRLHTKATRRRRRSMTGEKAAGGASLGCGSWFLQDCLSSRTRALIMPDWRIRAPPPPANGRLIRD
jgi:hypothetical protein